MKKLNRVAAAGGAILAIAASGITSARATASSPKAIWTMNTPISTQRDTVSLLTGSATDLIYATRPTETRELFRGAAAEPTSTLWARKAAGKTLRLGPLPANDRGFSTVGSTVTALHVGAHAVDVWQISAQHPHTTLHIPSGSYYLSSAPGGVLVRSGTALDLLKLNGSVVSYGTPFAGAAANSAATNAKQLVVTSNHGAISSMSYADPGSFTPLAGGANNIDVTCVAISATDAACRDGILVPLDGSTNVLTADCANGTALAGTKLFWTDDCSDDTQLNSQAFGGDQATSDEFVDFGLVSAFDKAIALSPDGHTVYDASTADQLTTLFNAPKSPTTVGAFALTDHRVAYIGDRRDRKSPKRITSVVSRKLRITKRSVTGSTSHKLSRPTPHPAPSVIAASDTATVYLTTSGAAHFDVHIVTKRDDQALHDVAYNTSQVLVSNHWALVTGGPHPGVTAVNLATGKVKLVLGTKQPRAVALSGNHLAYGTPQGRIYRVNLNTGHTRTVYKPKGANRRLTVLTVVTHGAWVGWDIAPAKRSAPDIDGMRNVHRSHVLDLAHRVYGMSSRGVLMRGPMGFFEATKIWLQPFAGKEDVLLSKRVFDEFPQLTSTTLAWVDSDGVLKLTRAGD